MALLSIAIKSWLKGTPLGKYMRRRKWNQGILSVSGIEKTVRKYLGDVSVEEMAELTRDILGVARKYRFSAEEYFCYHFRDKSDAERAEFISDLNRIDFCERLNKYKNLAIFDDKMKSAEVFSRYYGRELVAYKSERDREEVLAFIGRHPRFMIKPLSGTCGAGIEILDFTGKEREYIAAQLAHLGEVYTRGGGNGFIAEELVVSAPSLAAFHPASLNTVRIATVKFPEGVEPIAAFFRMGRSGSIVDNAGAGGVFGTIDLTRGVITHVGDEYGNFYETHPDTGLAVVGFEIPRWEEAKRLACELAEIVDGNLYGGWDLALTDSGWVMIEGNARGQFVWQMPTQKGFLREANAILRRLGKREMKKLSV